MRDFIKNHEILKEDFRVEDLLDFSKVIADFKDFLGRIKDNSIIGLIGKFGTGKSTMLYQLYKRQKEQGNEKWINFDAWKYPERKDLWEGFILEIAKELDPKLFKQTREKIDGQKHDRIRSLIRVFFSGANLFLPGFSIGENFANLFRSSPAKRIFEFQEILKKLLNKEKRNIFIIIEDIDRSGDKGAFFLETLRNFIKESDIKNKIYIIVPIGNEIYYPSKDNKFRDSYDKCIDYPFDFNRAEINFSDFIKEIFKEKQFKDNFIIRLNYLFKRLVSKKDFTIRQIKALLRCVSADFQIKSKKDEKIDAEIYILFSVMQYLQLNFAGSPPTDYSLRLIKDMGRAVMPNNFIYDSLIWAANFTENKLQTLYSQYRMDIPIILYESNNYLPVLNDRSVSEYPNGHYSLSKKYLEYLNI